ncbi:MAG: ABC transporter ATP-binding protein [Desulfobacterium sp.]|nr:ABC transporter ATP-binding protein [Desulfobacterium sp.]
MTHMELKSVSVRFGDRAGCERQEALASVDLKIIKGEVLGVMGESGAGKTTLARVLTGWFAPSQGEILFNGAPLEKGERRIQLLWQDAASHLNPYFTVERLVGEPLVCFKGLRRGRLGKRVGELMDWVGLPRKFLERKPHELSGGQCQRVALARVLAADPAVLVCDEPFSGLDVGAQIRIRDLLARINRDVGLTLVVISHDPLPLKPFCHRVAVMTAGKILLPSVLRKNCSPLHPAVHIRKIEWPSKFSSDTPLKFSKQIVSSFRPA